MYEYRLELPGLEPFELNIRIMSACLSVPLLQQDPLEIQVVSLPEWSYARKASYHVGSLASLAAAAVISSIQAPKR